MPDRKFRVSLWVIQIPVGVPDQKWNMIGLLINKTRAWWRFDIIIPPSRFSHPQKNLSLTQIVIYSVAWSADGRFLPRWRWSGKWWVHRPPILVYLLASMVPISPDEPHPAQYKVSQLSNHHLEFSVSSPEVGVTCKPRLGTVREPV
jgi:hypothetical protein